MPSMLAMSRTEAQLYVETSFNEIKIHFINPHGEYILVELHLIKICMHTYFSYSQVKQSDIRHTYG